VDRMNPGAQAACRGGALNLIASNLGMRARKLQTSRAHVPSTPHHHHGDTGDAAAVDCANAPASLSGRGGYRSWPPAREDSVRSLPKRCRAHIAVLVLDVTAPTHSMPARGTV
jgi:hypothetical protein